MNLLKEIAWYLIPIIGAVSFVIMDYIPFKIFMLAYILIWFIIQIKGSE